jgi:hypothetical protein
MSDEKVRNICLTLVIITVLIGLTISDFAPNKCKCTKSSEPCACVSK